MDINLTIEKLKLENAIEVFTKYMKVTLLRKAEEGYRGHDDEGCRELMRGRLRKHMALALDGSSKSYVHIACLAMFLYFLAEDPQ